MRIAVSECSAGNTSSTSPRTRKRAAREFELVALVLHRRQARDDVALRQLLVLAQVQDHAVVIDRVADAVDARHGGDDDGVLALEQRLGRRQAHLLDVLVDARVLLDEQVARGHVGLGLVVIVVGDEILDRVLGEELAHLGIQLRRQRLVRRDDQRRPPLARDHVGHGVGLARAGHAEQRLVGEPVLACPRPACAMASGWSPAGSNCWCSWNGLLGKVTIKGYN